MIYTIVVFFISAVLIYWAVLGVIGLAIAIFSSVESQVNQALKEANKEHKTEPVYTYEDWQRDLRRDKNEN